jgi:hypothetical protein
MKKSFILLFVASIFSIAINAQNIELRGTYQGENLYVQNPFAVSGVGFCVYEVTVNGMTTTDEINSSAFEVDLSVFEFTIGDQISVSIRCKEGCTARVVNPEVLKPRATFEIVSVKVETTNLVWTTINEAGPLTFYVEQYRWNKWVTIAEVTGIGTSEENVYKVALRMHSGDNRFRVRQTDSRKVSKFSKEVTARNRVEPVTYKIEGSSQIVFSRPTMYEIYDYYGRIVFKGFGDVVNIGAFEKGKYHLNFDNKQEIFSKR